MNDPKTKHLTGRRFGYRLDDGDERGPMFIVAEVTNAPRGFDLGDDAVWCRCYSEQTPEGEEATVPVSWLHAEIDPLMVYAARHWFEDIPAERLGGLAERFPLIEYRPTFGPLGEVACS
jgi:hypothetical protein